MSAPHLLRLSARRRCFIRTPSPFRLPITPAARRSYSSTTTTASSSEVPDIYDVVIVGGGPAGLSLASALRSSPITSNLKVALIEGQPLLALQNWKAAPGTFSNRVVSLTPGSVGFLKEIGVWEKIQEERVQPYEDMKVWDGISGASISFHRDLLPTSPTIAYMTENLNLTSACLQHLQQTSPSSSPVEILDSTRVDSISLGPETTDFDLTSWPVITTSTGRKLAARLLVGADGANSPVRTFAEIETRGWDYGRFGVVATLKLAEAEKVKKAWQRFLPSGPVAFLPLPGDFATLVWSTTPQHAAALKSLSTKDMTAMVNAAFRLSPVDIDFMLSNMKTGISEEVEWRESATPADESLLPTRVVDVQEGSVAMFPLKMRHADSYIAERVALIGDAAHSVHPLAGQGLNQGLGDVKSLSKTIENAILSGQDIGATLSLEPYYEEQYFKNHMMLGVVDKLHKLYGTDSAPVVAIRSLGLKAVDAVDAVKGFIMGQTANR